MKQYVLDPCSFAEVLVTLPPLASNELVLDPCSFAEVLVLSPRPVVSTFGFRPLQFCRGVGLEAYRQAITNASSIVSQLALAFVYLPNS